MVSINQQVYDNYKKFITGSQNGSKTEGVAGVDDKTKLEFDYAVLQEIMADEGSEAVLLILEQLKSQGENIEGPTVNGDKVSFKYNGDSYELYIAAENETAKAKGTTSSSKTTTIINGMEYTDEEIAFLESLPKDLFNSWSGTNYILNERLINMLSDESCDKLLNYFGLTKAETDRGILQTSGKFYNSPRVVYANNTYRYINSFSNVYITNATTNQMYGSGNSTVDAIRSALYGLRTKTDYKETLADIFAKHNVEYKIVQEANKENGFVCTVKFSVDGVKYSMSMEPNRVVDLNDVDYLNQTLFGGELTAEKNFDYEVYISNFSRCYGASNIFERGFGCICQKFSTNDKLNDFLDYYKKMYMPDADINFIPTNSGGVVYAKVGSKTYTYEISRMNGSLAASAREDNEYEFRYDNAKNETERNSWIYTMSYYSKDFCDLDENLLNITDKSNGKSVADILEKNRLSDSIMESGTALQIIEILVKNGISSEISYTDDKKKGIITVEYNGKTSQMVIDNIDGHGLDYIAGLKGEIPETPDLNLADIKPDSSECLPREEIIKKNPLDFPLDSNGNVDVDKLAEQLTKSYKKFGGLVGSKDFATIFGYGTYNSSTHEYDIPDKNKIKSAIIEYMQKNGVSPDSNGNYDIVALYNAICNEETSNDKSRSKTISGTIDDFVDKYNYEKKFGFDKCKGLNGRDWPKELTIIDSAFDSITHVFGYQDGPAAAIWPENIIFYLETGVVKRTSEQYLSEKNYNDATIAALLKLAGYDANKVDNIDWDNLEEHNIYEQLGTSSSELSDKISELMKKIDSDNGSVRWCSAYDLMEYLADNGYSANYYSEFTRTHNTKTKQETFISEIGSPYTPEDQEIIEEAEDEVTETVTTNVAENIEAEDNFTITQEEIDEIFEKALDDETRKELEDSLNDIDNLGIVDGKTADDIINKKQEEIKQKVEIIAALFTKTKELEGHPNLNKMSFVELWQNKVALHFRDEMADQYPEDFAYYQSIIYLMQVYLNSRIGENGKTATNVDIIEFLQIYLKHYNEIEAYYNRDNWWLPDDNLVDPSEFFK